jgi:hypothetical protein
VVGAYPSVAPLRCSTLGHLALPTIIRLSWKSLPGINTLAYYNDTSITAVKSFIILFPVFKKSRKEIEVFRHFGWWWRHQGLNWKKMVVSKFVKLQVCQNHLPCQGVLTKDPIIWIDGGWPPEWPEVWKNNCPNFRNVSKTIANLQKLKLKVKNRCIKMLLNVKISTTNFVLKLLIWVEF